MRGRGRRLPHARRRGRRGLPAALLRQSRRTSGGSPRSCATRCPALPSPPRPTCCRWCANTSARWRRCSTPWSCPASRPTSRGWRSAWTTRRSSAPLLLMQSNGGVAGGATIRRAPALTALSGPAAGVVGARDVAAACGITDIITVDIGGTSADICLIKDGRIDAHPARPCRRMAAAAADGRHGDDRRRRRLDRQGRGRHADRRPAERRRRSRPGRLRPRRRSEATVTDAHVVLGHLPAKLLGGRMTLDADAARRGDRARGRRSRSGSTREAAARGILADHRQQHGGRAAHRLGRARPRSARFHAGAVRRRRAAARLLAGRAARHHAGADPARAGRAVRRRAAGGRPQGRVQPHPAQGRRRSTSTAARAIFAELDAQADDWLAAEQVAPADRQQRRVALLRYHGQGGEVAVGWVDDAGRSRRPSPRRTRASTASRSTRRSSW